MRRFVTLLSAFLLCVCALCPTAFAAGLGDNDVFDDWDREVIPGDINGDKVVDGLDLIALRTRIAGLQNDGTFITKAADLDGNGEIDGLDLMELRRMIAGL